MTANTLPINQLGQHGLQGTLRFPGDKSISHRALMFSTLCNQPCEITGLAQNQDVLATKACLEQMGVVFEATDKGLKSKAHQGLQAPEQTLDAQNSGTTIRLMSGILAAQNFSTTITGDVSLQKRPMGRIIKPLAQMGARIDSQDGKAPLTIHATTTPLTGFEYTLPQPSAQVKSAILLAGLFAQGDTIIHEPLPSRDHTERMLRAMGVTIQQENNTLTLPEKQITALNSVCFDVPGDISSAAFFMVAASLIPNSNVTLANISLNPYRTGIIGALKRVGANITIQNEHEACGEPVGDVTVKHARLSGDLTLNADDIPALIDEIPILTVASLFLDGTFTVTGAEELRVKESDRIQVMADELAKVGVTVQTRDDGLQVAGNPNQTLTAPTAPFEAHHDHRIAMSLATLNMISDPNTRWPINGDDCIAVSFPNFYDCYQQLIQ